MKNGKTIDMVDMKTSHIENCISLLERFIDFKNNEKTDFRMFEADEAHDLADGAQKDVINAEIKLSQLKEELASRSPVIKYDFTDKHAGKDFYRCLTCGAIDWCSPYEEFQKNECLPTCKRKK